MKKNYSERVWQEKLKRERKRDRMTVRRTGDGEIERKEKRGFSLISVEFENGRL